MWLLLDGTKLLFQIPTWREPLENNSSSARSAHFLGVGIHFIESITNLVITPSFLLAIKNSSGHRVWFEIKSSIYAEDAYTRPHGHCKYVCFGKISSHFFLVNSLQTIYMYQK